MTEKEAFEQWFEDGHTLWAKQACHTIWKAACEWQRSVCNEELVMLRQRVAELARLVAEAEREEC